MTRTTTAAAPALTLLTAPRRDAARASKTSSARPRPASSAHRALEDRLVGCFG